MPFINLHNHSAFSDGTLAPEHLARVVKKAGIDFFALTDHDTMDGWGEMEEALKQEKIHYCYGVEISCSPYENLHLLGYGIDPHNEKFREILKGYRSRRAERIKKVLALLKEQGIEIKFEDLPVPEGKTVGRPHVADIMTARRIVPSRSQAFRRYLAPSKPAYVPPNGPSVEEACAAVRAAGGLPVLAHPGCAATHLELAKWKDAGLAGLEAFYPAHSNTLTREFVNLAARFGLFVTAGIDFHGPGTERDKMYGFVYKEEYFSEISRIFL